MNYNYRYRIEPAASQRETLDAHRDICRQLYNHALYRFNQIPETAGTVTQRVRSIRDELPALKDWWETLTDVYAKVLQPTVMRIAHNVSSLGGLKAEGYDVGELRWKSPREFRSFTYNQSGFELDKKSGPTGWGLLSLSKIGDIPIRLHHQNRRFWLVARRSLATSGAARRRSDQRGDAEKRGDGRVVRLSRYQARHCPTPLRRWEDSNEPPNSCLNAEGGK